MCIPLGQTCEKHASMDFHVKNMSAGSDPKYINHSLFFFLARIVPIDRRIKKKHQGRWSNQDLFDLFLPRESYIENYYFLCSCVRINHFDSLLIAKNMSNLFWKKRIVVVKLYVETWIQDAISISTKGNFET